MSSGRKSQVFFYIMLALFVIAGFQAAIFYGWKQAVAKHPPAKVEAFLEECMMQDVSVTVDTWACFTRYISSDYIPYIGNAILKDGSHCEFLIQWEKDTKVDNGVYSDYGVELAKHYLSKYGISHIEDPYNNRVNVYLKAADLSGDTPMLQQCLTDIWEEQYVQAGQEVQLYFESEVGYSKDCVLNGEPFDYEEYGDILTKFLEE